MSSITDQLSLIYDDVMKMIEYNPNESILDHINGLTDQEIIKSYFHAIQLRIQNHFQAALDVLDRMIVPVDEKVLEFIIYVEKIYNSWHLQRNEGLAAKLDRGFSLYKNIDSEMRQRCSEEYARLLNVKGNYHWVEGNLLETLKFYFEAVKIRERLDRPISQAISYHNIGLLFLNFGMVERAEQKMDEALALIEPIDIPGTKALILQTAGSVQLEAGQIESALNYLNDSLSCYERTDEIFGKLVVKCAIIRCSLILLDTNTAEQVLRDLEEMTANEEDPKLLALRDFAKAMVLKNKNRLQEKAAAQRLFSQLHHNMYLDFDKRVIVMKNLAESLAIEFRIFKELSVFEELSDLVNNMAQQAEKNAMFGVYLESMILKAKLFMIREDFHNADQVLIEAKEEAQKIGLVHYLKIIDRERLEVLSQLKELEMSVGRHQNLLENFKSAEIESYLHSILRITQVDGDEDTDME